MILADVTEVESRTSDVDMLPLRLLPEMRTRSVNSGTADINAEETVYLNDDMEIEDDLVDLCGGMEELELTGSDLFGFRTLRPEVSSGQWHTSGLSQSGQQTTVTGNNVVC